MELSTFGALLAFAIELEERAASFYRRAAEGCEGLREVFLAFARESESHRRLLLSTRRENVTEMVLEPIAGLRRGDYEVEGESTPGLPCEQLVILAVEAEEKAHRFYSDAANRAEHSLAGVTRSFIHLRRGREQRLEKLRRQISSRGHSEA